MADARTIPELEEQDLEDLLQEGMNDARLITIWEVRYDDERRKHDQEVHYSAALFRTEQGARGFALRCRSVTYVDSRNVSIREFSRLRRLHMIGDH